MYPTSGVEEFKVKRRKRGDNLKQQYKVNEFRNAMETLGNIDYPEPG